MKRLTLIALIALFSLNIMAQAEEPVDKGVSITVTGLEAVTDSLILQTATVTDTDFEKLFDKYTAQAGAGINNLLKSVQENFTDEAEFVWDTYIMAYKIQFYRGVMLIIIALMLIVPPIFLWKHAVKSNANYPSEEVAGVFAIIFWAVSVFMFVTGVAITIVNLSYMIVPEYHVIQDLISILK